MSRFRPRACAAALALVTACLVHASLAHAEDRPPPPRVMSLPEALTFARQSQPAIKVARARVAAEEEAARIPRAEWLPSVGVSLQIFAATANNTTASFINVPGVQVARVGSGTVTATGSAKPYPSTFAGAGLTQEVFDFGRIAAQAAAADALVEVARQRAASEKLEVDFAVEEAFYAVHAAKAVRRAADEAEGRARAHRDLAKAGTEAGMRSPVELTRAEADLARFALGRERAAAGVAVAMSLYAAAVGVPEAALDVPDTSVDAPDLPSLADAVQRAAARDPAILEAEARLRAQTQTTKAIAAETRPNLVLSSAVNLVAGGAPPSGTAPPAKLGGWVPDVPNWDVGLVLTWPIWSGTVAARERASRAREGVQREELERIRYARAVAVRQAYVGATVARSALAALGRAAAAARANYDQAEARFKSGLGNSVELADAEALRVQAEIDLALGRFEIARARVALARATAEEP